MSLDDPRRAYAILGVQPGVSAEALKRRYRELVRTWHPDRFASDPAGRAEAEQRLREINLAYDALSASPVPPPVDAPAAAESAPPPAPRQPGARLSRAQIDAMVAAIGTRSLVEETFASLGRLGDVLRFGALLVALLLLVAAALRDDGAGLPLVALVAGAAVWRELRVRRRLRRARGASGAATTDDAR